MNKRIINKNGSAKNPDHAESQEEMAGAHGEAVREINRLHGDIFAASRLTAENAIKIGSHLVELRMALSGTWLLFVKKNLPFTVKTAERYMNVFNNREALATEFDTMSNFTLSQAYRFLAGPEKGAQDPEPKEEEGKPAAAGKAEIITELSRSVCDGLHKLPDGLLERFKDDVIAFKAQWLEQHSGEVAS